MEIRDSPELRDKHPWGEDLANVAHIGWASGAPNPDRCDWSALQAAETVWIVADNDASGKRAIPRISRRLNCPTYQVQFSELIPLRLRPGGPVPGEIISTSIRGRLALRRAGGPGLSFPGDLGNPRDREGRRRRALQRRRRSSRLTGFENASRINGYGSRRCGPSRMLRCPCPCWLKKPGRGLTAVFRTSPGSRTYS